MKFIGHLDVMRFFQKVMRRAEVDIKYSEGYSPHQIMSFASPLGVGLTSAGEYLDIEVNSTMESDVMIAKLNDKMVEGIKVINYVKLPEESKNAMSLVEAADYFVSFRDGYKPCVNIEETFSSLMSKDSIVIMKKTKKSELEVDILPMILSYSVKDNGIFMKLCAGSANNLKPELVMSAYYESIGKELGKFDLEIERLELYGRDEDKLIPLVEYGEIISEVVQ